VQSEGAWLRLELTGDASNRDAVGARVEVQVGSRLIYRQRTGGSSYLSDHDPRLLIGLGRASRAESVTVRWPSGAEQRFANVEVNRGYRLVEGGELDLVAIESASR